MLNRSVSRLAGVLLLSLLPVPAVAGLAELASYRAVYDLAIDDGREQGRTSVTGRLVVEFTGSRCAGYASKMRFVTESQGRDGVTQVTDARTETLETANGAFEFTNQTFVNDELAEESAGAATRTDDGVTVALTKPAKKTFDAGDVAFPTEQLRRILDAADRGEHFVPMDVYDGSQTGDIIFATATVIGAVSTAADDYGDEALVNEAGFAGEEHWPLTISYFEKDGGTDDAPSYVTSFVSYANGIGRKLKIDYGKFALIGRITHLEILPTPGC